MKGKLFRKTVAGISTLAMIGSVGLAVPISAGATDYTDQAVDLSKFDVGGSYDSESGTETVSIGSSRQWSKLDLTPYTQHGEEKTLKVTISYKETMSSAGRTTVGFYDSDLAGYATNAYEDTAGSPILYGLCGDKSTRVYINAGRNNTNLTLDAEQTVTLTYDLENKTFSGSIGSYTIPETAFAAAYKDFDSVDVMAIYSWSETTYKISDMKITTITSNDTYYDVVYSVNGVESSESVKEGETVKEIPDTTRAGYIFKGWSTDGSTDYEEGEDYITQEELLAMPIDSAMTFTAVYATDTAYIEPIVAAEISGPSSMTFGPDPNTAASNDYTLTLTGENGTVITAETADPRVEDFNIEWTLDGFKTENDTEGQYCDSYGEFADYTSTATNVSFLLRQVSFNFYGTLSAKVTYNGDEISASVPVVALGDTSVPATQIAPAGGYPSDMDEYSDSLVGYNLSVSANNQTGDDLITGGFYSVGSDTTKSASLSQDETGKFLRLTKGTTSKSAMMGKMISTSAGQLIAEQDIRFNSAGGCVTLTKGYPTWSSSSSYAAVADVTYNGSGLTLIGQPLMNGENETQISAGTWYKLVFSIDTVSGQAWAKLYDAAGTTLLGEVSNVNLASDAIPEYYAVGIDNSYTGSTDLGSYRIYTPTADTSTFTLTASQDTLSIPNGDTAELSASLTTAEGYDIMAETTWTVLEQDMQGVIVTPYEDDPRRAMVTLSDDAQAGTATVQVNIGGNVKTIVLNITSSAESVKFTTAPTSISIPLDTSSTATASYEASVVTGTGEVIEGRDVTYALYDRNNINPYTPGEGITFDAETATITVTSAALPATFSVRATGQNTDGETISRAVTVTVHGLTFDLGSGEEGSVVEGYTEVTPSTYYTDSLGFGIEGTATAGGTASDTDAAADYLEGTFVFKAKVTPGELYRVTVDFSGDLVTEYHDSVIAGHTRTLEAESTQYTGYTVKTAEIAQQVYDVPVVDDVLDLNFTGAKVAAIKIDKVSREANAKPSIYAIGDSTLGNNGSYGYVLARDQANYPELTSLITRYNNNGKGSRTLSTYVTQGWLDGVLASIKPGDIVTIGNMGTNTGGLSGAAFKAPLDYYVDACLAMGAKVILTSYTPHGAVGDYASCYNSETHTFSGIRTDAYDSQGIRVIYEERKNDPNILGFIDIGKDADDAFNAYVADYETNGYASADEAAQAIIACFSDHNHYSNDPLACTLMLEGYGDVNGIVENLVNIITEYNNRPDEVTVTFIADDAEVAVRSVLPGGTITDIPAVPAKDGFTGKWMADGVEFTSSTVVNGNMTVTAEYTPSEEPSGEVTATDFALNEGTATAAVSNTTDSAVSVTVYVAAYDTNGTLISVQLATKTIAADGTETFEVANESEAASYKAFVWNDAYNAPLADAQ